MSEDQIFSLARAEEEARRDQMDQRYRTAQKPPYQRDAHKPASPYRLPGALAEDGSGEGGSGMIDKERGLFDKYEVRRSDGKRIGWCFVLEDKDPHAVPALRAYVASARADGYVYLADDLEIMIQSMVAAQASGDG